GITPDTWIEPPRTSTSMPSIAGSMLTVDPAGAHPALWPTGPPAKTVKEVDGTGTGVSTVSVNDFSRVTPYVSVAATVNANVPADVGVPWRRPAVLSEMPDGKLPEEIA